MVLKSLIGLSCLIVSLVSASVNASTIFAPTDGDVNFLNSTITLDANTQVAIFNVGDLGGTNHTVVLNDVYSASLAKFTFSGGNYSVDSKAGPSSPAFDTMTLLGTDNFILGLTKDSGINWAADTGYTSLGGSLYNVHFTDGTILEVDVQVVPV
ncbi:MAG: hypothetical protein KJN89_12770, partial [Gammaproteobacteria bacterium]|nr:hypothetical protein [Gammaproteobacteria bacterium]NNJ51239.1 hypothetical protein [Gammaproteobacteria bacterium]